MYVGIKDDLKANFRSWEQDCDNEEDAMLLTSIMIQRHPGIDPEVTRQLCYDWVGLDF